MDSDLRSRVARALGDTPRQKPAPQPVQAPDPLLTFRMWCSATGKTSNIVARRDGDTLWLLRNVQPSLTGTSKDAGGPPPLLGRFNFKDAGWPGCAHCGAKYNNRKKLYLIWLCESEICGYPLHCVGERNHKLRCACGVVDDFSFPPPKPLEVHGTTAAPERSSIGSVSHSSGPSLPNVSPRLPNVAPRLPYSGK